MNLSEHIAWLSTQNYKPGSADCICQCGSEIAIKRCNDPEKMRAELLSYVFLDQFMYTHYFNSHQQFKSQLPGPMLRQHSFGGHASPSWFVYSRHGYDAEVGWEMICSTFSDYLQGGLQWLKQQSEVEDEDYWEKVRKEITDTFEPRHHHYFIGALDKP